MKICAVICEFNPFHNGHKYLLEKASVLSKCDKILCIMSGNFTQRGEICVASEKTRAHHAVSSGADCVIELPAAFTVAPAEIFAQGAVKILSSIPDIAAIAFGCENIDFDYKRSAELLINESDEFSATLNMQLESGESYIKSYAAAFEKCGGNTEILQKPNNILGLEYAKSIIRSGTKIELYPIKRIGSDFNDGELKENYSSAKAIRNNLNSIHIKNNLPDFVYEDLKDAKNYENKFKDFAAFELLKTAPETLKRIFGCSEGLENRILSFAGENYQTIISKCTSKRYPSSRIKRILCANMLGLYKDDCRDFLKEKLYLKPLAVKGLAADEILSALSKSEFPLITRGKDKEKLSATARKCLDLDERAAAIRKFISN